MDNHENLAEELNALTASTYAGGNSFAARKARAEIQNRDDEGKFAFMFGLMRLVMRQNGIPVATFSRFVGGSDRGENMGWFHVNSEDGSVPEGFYRYPVDLASDMGGRDSNVQAVLPGDYLASKGIDLKNPSSFGNFPNVEDLDFQTTPPDFIEHPDIDGAFISDDGDITIEPNEFGGWDVVDNVDPQNSVQSVDDLGEAMKAIHAIDMTRKDYVPMEFDRVTMTDALLPSARDVANPTPVATLPVDATPEASKADPAGMTNKDLGEEVARFERIYGGRTTGMDEETKARYDLVDNEWELRLDEHEDQFENPDFVRDPSKSEAPVATIPASEEQLAELRELQSRAIADGGLSLSFADGTAPTDGFMVSFEAKNKLGIVSKADFEDAEKGPRAIFNFLMDNQEFLDGDGNFFGVWFDNDENIYDNDNNVIGTKPEAERNPSYFLDVSQNVADRQEAIDLGIERNQKAVWDVIKQESISTGGTGEGKKDGTDSAPDGQDGSGSDGDSKDSLGESEQELTPEQQSGLAFLTERLAGMTNGEVRDEGYEISNAYERLDLDEAEPSAFLKAQAALVRAEYNKRQQKMDEESPDTKGYFPQGDIVSGTHGFDNNTTFFYEEDVEGNIAYGRQNYSPDGGLVSEEVFEADSIEDARNKVIAMIDEAGVGTISAESIDDLLTRLDLVNDPDFINKAVDTMFDPENGTKSIKTDEYEFGGSVSVDEIMQEGSINGTLEVFDPQGGESKIFNITFPMDGFSDLGERYNQQQLAQEIKNKLAEAGVGTVEAPLTPADAVDSVNKSLEGQAAEEEARYQAWLDSDGLAKVEGLFEKISQIRRDALFRGTVPEGYDVEADPNLLKLRDDISNEINDIASVDGVVSPRVLQDMRVRAGRQDIAENLRMGVVADLNHFNQRRVRDEANPELLDSLFTEYDVDGSARALFDSGASYDEIYANLQAQGTGWGEGYDPYWRMQEYVGNSSETTHEKQMGVIRRAVELRDNARPVIEDAPSLDDELRTAIQSGNAVQVIEARRRKDALDSVVDSVNADIPVVDTTPEVTEVPSESVTEIPTISDYQFDYVTPTAEDLRRSGPLDDFGIEEIREGLREAVINGKQEVVLGGETYPISAVVVHLYNRYGFDSEVYIAGVLDATYGGSENLDAIQARRRGTSDVTREEQGTTGQPSPQEVLETWLSTAPLIEIVNAYTTAVGRGEDTVTVSLQDFGVPESQGSSSVDIPVQEVRQRLSDSGYDMDTIDGYVESNEQAREQVAEASGLSVEDATASAQPRTDWRDVLNQGSEEFSNIYFVDKNGNPQRYQRREDGKWYDLGNLADKGKTTASIIRKITRDADPGVLIEIDDGNPHDEDPTYDFNAHAFEFGSEQDEEVAIDETIANDAWMHVSGGDLEAMRELERAGVTFNILDKMAELFLNGERRGGDEVVTETHEYTDPATGAKYRFEVVVTRTPDEYFYTYVRRTNLTTGESWSARVGHMAQSPYATFNNYRLEIAKFHASFFNGKGPVNWFDSDATRRRKKRDVLDPDTNQWVHAKDIQHNPQTMASIRALLGIARPSTTETRRAEDAVMGSILNAISKYRLNDKWMGIMAEHISQKYGRNIDKAYMYQVADVYEAHMMNQNNLDRYGTWVSSDQRTPLDAGDTVEHLSGRRGVVRKRLGWVDSLGRYRYSDYVEVRWNSGQTSWTTSRMNRLIQTSGGTDGSERVGYRDGYQDPRADHGTAVADGTSVPVPEYVHVPAPPVTVERVEVIRNENSELVLPNGTVIPEKPVGSVNQTSRSSDGSDVQVGDYISVTNDDRQPVMAPVIGDSQYNPSNGLYNYDIAVRNADGTYTVENLAWSPNAGVYFQVFNYNSADGARTQVTPAQLNEVLELLGSQELPTGFPLDGLIRAYSSGLVGGDVVQGTFTSSEIADIIQELRALPDRPSTPAEDAAMLADVASVEAERNNNAGASQEFETLADGANIVASQSPSEEADTIEEPSAPEAPATEAPATPETSRGPVPESMNGTQILDPQWVSDAPVGTRVYSTSTGRAYEKADGDIWNQVLNGEVVSGGNSNTNLLSQRVSSGTLYVGSTPPAVLPPGSQLSAAVDRNRYPQIPNQLSEIVPDVSAGWVDVPAETQINNPDWFAGAPVGTRVTLDGVLYEKREDGNWYPTTGSFTENPYSSEVMGTLGLLSRADQGQNASDVPSPREWELLPEGSAITDRDYIVSAPVGTVVALQLSDGSAPLRFAKLGSGKWELASTRKLFTNEQLTYRLENSNANTFTALPSEDTAEVSTVVSSLSELREFSEGTILDTFTAGVGQRKRIKRVGTNWQVLNARGGVTYVWDDTRVMRFIRDGGVVNNGIQPNRFAVVPQGTSNNQSGASPARLGTRRPNSTPAEINYTPGSFQTDVTPEQFREIIRSGNKEALKALLVEHLQGKKFGKLSIGTITVGTSAFSASIIDENGNNAGKTTRVFEINSDGNVYVYNAWMEIDGLRNRGNGFSTNYTEAMYDFYRQLGVSMVSVTAGLSEGAYTWARAGFGFVGAIPEYITDRLRSELSLAIREGRMQDAMVLNNMLQRILRGGTDTPTAKEIADIAGQLQFYPAKGGTLGRELMAGSGKSWSGVRSIPTLEESLAFMAARRRAYEQYLRQRNERSI